ncbi:MAG: class I SAM-dependent methyltransferase [Thermoplasmata archaeon]|jgi:tRNA wybutosine-synthesizing protein 2|nr:class I SAM-dependent methyltransferase family protein [Thermoplasmatales archaeon]
MLHLKVEKENAEKIRFKLMENRWLHPDFEIFSDGRYVYFPLKEGYESGENIVDIEGMFRKKKKNPYDKILEILHMDDNLKNKVPHHWEKYGDVVLIQLPEILYSYRKDIGRAFAEVLKAKSVLLYKGVEGEFRKPLVEFIFGNDAVTTHTENGIFYRFDASRIMFSSGNVDERIRMSRIDAVGERVVDMFAGIGYFSIPISKYCFPERVIAIEKNEEAYKYLVENIKLNGVSVDPILSDNRDVNIRDYADRVIMGYIHSEEFIPFAVRMLKQRGIIHYHDTWRKEQVQDRYETINSLFGDFNYSVLRFHIVKNYAPNILHVSIDLLIRKV